MGKPGKICTEDNGDGTRSMRIADSWKLLVKFQTACQDYDKLMSKEALLNPSTPLKVVPAYCCPRLLPNVFLCDNCGYDFQSLASVNAHERTCSLKDSSLQPTAASEHFFQSLGLSLTGPASTKASEGSIGQAIKVKASSYTKFFAIDITSPLGQYVLNNSNIASMCCRERRDLRSPLGSDSFPVTYRVPKDTSKITQKRRPVSSENPKQRVQSVV